MKRPDKMRMPNKIIRQEIIDKYNLNEIVDDGPTRSNGMRRRGHMIMMPSRSYHDTIMIVSRIIIYSWYDYDCIMIQS